jgi:hypothetical protein
MKLFVREKDAKPEQPQNSQEPLDVVELRAKVSRLERVVKLLDYDLQDAIDGFYRRRQSDRMREVREEDAPKRKRTTDKDILMRALQLSDDGRRKNETDDSHKSD